MRSLFIASIILSGCTLSINVVRTQGEASDVIDETVKPTNDVSATIPISAIPK